MFEAARGVELSCMGITDYVQEGRLSCASKLGAMCDQRSCDPATSHAWVDKHERAVRFLIERLEKSEPGHEPLNYIQVLGISKDPRAIPAIRRYFERYSEPMEKEKVIGVPTNVVLGPIPYHQYFVVCEALLKITGATEYDDAIRKYLDHENEQSSMVG